jgi:hypothetical protein
VCERADRLTEGSQNHEERNRVGGGAVGPGVLATAGGRSRLQSLAALGIDAIAVPQSNVLDGINVTRRPDFPSD